MNIQYVTFNIPIHIEHGNNFAEGMKRHDCNVQIVPHQKFQPSDKIDLVVVWGISRASRIVMDKCNNLNIPVIVTECGYVGCRVSNLAFGYNDLNRHANFFNGDSPSDRFEKHIKPVMKNWNLIGEYILVTGQVYGDRTLDKFPNHTPDYNPIIKELRAHTDRPIVFRKHPEMDRKGISYNLTDVEFSKGSLIEDLEGAHCVVTINSNTCIDAMMNGKPCITLDDRAMAYDITQHTFDNIEHPQVEDRIRWAKNLAYCQWSTEEIKNGDVWDHLKQGIA